MTNQYESIGALRPGLLSLVAVCACSSPASAPDAPAEPEWATYVIRAGRHDAQIIDRSLTNPTDGVSDAIGRDYELILDPSAIYELVDPVEPTDQLDWNKLPGLSDCNQTDLKVDGLMFGWRWRIDLVPHVLEITAYANNAGVHLTPSAPLFVLDADDLGALAPLHYRVWRESATYQFSVDGEVRGRAIDASVALPRRCSTVELDPLAWASAFYFGGTTTAPHEMTAKIREAAFVP
ncbi:MAG: hypothetical protein H0T42_27745 [Deltaproteobacteria bacterium]|nr:hypothetical protein [Deltaproteobacteria bacterium]